LLGVERLPTPPQLSEKQSLALRMTVEVLGEVGNSREDLRVADHV